MKKYLRWPLFLVLSALLVAALVPAFSLLHSGKPLQVHASGGASITLSQSTGQPGTILQASGQGFAPNDQIDMYLNQANGMLLASAPADANGNLPATNITIPKQPAGQYLLLAVQEISTLTVGANFSIVPTFTLSQKIVQPGSLITMTGIGFGAFDYIELFLDSTNGSSFATTGADPSGNVSSSVRLPISSVLQGPHTVIAKSDETGDIASFPVTFLPRTFPVVGKAGMSVQLSGAAFTAAETVQVYWGTQTGQLEGSSTTDASGNLSFSFTAPTGLAPGSYPITIVRSHQKPALVTTLFKLIPVTMTATPGIRDGQQIKISLKGFLPYEGVTISWDANGGQQLVSDVTDKNGAFQTQFVPYSAPLGSYTLTAVGGTSNLQASSSVNVGPGVSGGEGNPGSMINITGGGFAAGEAVNVYFQKPANGVIPVTTDATGSFTAQLTLPSTYNPATTYYIHAVNAAGTEHATAKFIFSQPSFVIYGYAYYKQQINLVGASFAAGETVKIVWNYQQAGQYMLASEQADSTGSFTIYIPTPSTPNQTDITVAAVGATSKLVATTTISSYPAIIDSPSTGIKGTKVVVSGGSFGALETVTITFRGVTIATAQSDAQGAFTASFKVPAISGPGNVTVQATGATSGISAITIFSYTPILTITPSIAHDGDTITVTGKHFSATTNVFIYWPNGPGFGKPVLTDASGSFTTTFQLQGVSSGTYTVSAQDMLSNLFVSTPLVVQ